MKKAAFIVYFLFYVFYTDAQTATGVNFDAQNIGRISASQVLPFDRDCSLLITHFPNTKVRTVYLYEVTFLHGKRILVAHLLGSGLSIDKATLLKMASKRLNDRQKNKLGKFLTEHPNYLAVESQRLIEDHPIKVRTLNQLIRKNKYNYTVGREDSLGYSISHDSLTISFHPLRPAKYFDIQVNTAFSDDNQKLVLDLIKSVIKKDRKNWGTTYQKLKANTTEQSYSNFKSYNINIEYYDTFVSILHSTGWDTSYTSLSSSGMDSTPVFHRIGTLNTIDSELVRHKIPFSNVYKAIRIVIDSSWQDILKGFLTVDYIAAAPKADTFALPDRIANLNASAIYFDSLAIAIEQLVARTGGAGFLPTLDTTRRIATALHQRENSISNGYTALLTSISQYPQFHQSYMFGSSDTVVYLKTKANFLLTTDLGVTNIFARDYRNNLSYIPKLFFGVNIFFRQVDKNASYNTMKWRWREKGILSSRNPMEYLSLSLGLTIGNMSNNNFSNLYNTFSLTAGPSIRFAKSCRLTGGFAFLDRTRQNPLISSKQFVVGGFAAFSVDVDFLTPIQKVTDLIFK